MANHLSHSLPWNSLSGCFERKLDDPNSPDVRLQLRRMKGDKHSVAATGDGGLAAYKQLQHFARVFESTVAEFRASDKSTPEQQKALCLDKWHSYDNYWCMLAPQSVFCAYVFLNLLLLDESRWLLMLPAGGYLTRSHAFDCCLGETDMGHPDWIVAHAQPLFDKSPHNSHRWRETATLKPIKGDAQQTERIKEYLKLLFQVMYSSKPQDAATLTRYLLSGFGVREPEAIDDEPQ